MALRSTKNEVVLNNYDIPGADGTTNGPWRFNYSGTGGAITQAAIPGGGFDLAVGAGEDGIAEIVGPLVYEMDAGLPISFSCDLQVETDTGVEAAVFFGFTDRNSATEEIAIEDEDGTLATNATDAWGLMLEREQDATWQAVSVDTDVDGAQTALTDLPDVADDVWQRVEVRMEENSDGVPEARFYIDGKRASHTRVTHATPSVRLAPVISLDARATATVVRVRNIKVNGGGQE